MRCNGIAPAGLVGDSEGLVFEDRPGRHSPCTAGWGGLTGVTARRFTQNGSCRPLPVGSAPFLARALARNHASRVRWSTLGYVEKVLRPHSGDRRKSNANYFGVRKRSSNFGKSRPCHRSRYRERGTTELRPNVGAFGIYGQRLSLWSGRTCLHIRDFPPLATKIIF